MSDTPEAKATTTDTILGQIENAIASAQSGGSIADQVVTVFTSREVNKRADVLVKGFDQLAALSKSYNDINKPDIKQFGSAIASDSPTLLFSEKRRQEISSAKKKLDKLTTALNTALTKADYAGLEKALKGGDKDDE